MDETSCQLNNRPQQAIAAKGSKNVVNVKSAEKGETIIVVVCCDRESMLCTFLSSACTFKDYANLNEVHQAEHGRAPHVTGDVDVLPNSNSANSEIPIIDAKDNEIGNSEDNEELETDKENNDPGISNIDWTDHFDDERLRTSLDAILPVPVCTCT
ncbi:hypothetical protein Trydic_g16812 [Trypoxylus dichotomus]